MAEMQEAIERDEVIAPVADLTTNIGIHNLWHVRPTDVDRLATILKNAWRVKEIWDDEARSNPGAWFMYHYTNPTNLLFDIANGQGLVAFIKTEPGWRAQTYVAAWGREARRATHLWTIAARIATATSRLLVIDGFIKPENTLSQRAALAVGMTFRGKIEDAMSYNGVRRPILWYEIDCATLERSN